MSVGASRQYLGRLGKVDNGQVAVFGVLAKGRFATAIHTRLYLPKEWTDDVERFNQRPDKVHPRYLKNDYSRTASSG